MRRSLGLALTLLLVASPAGAWTVRELDTPRLTFPLGLAVAPDGALWVASTYADLLVRVEPATGVVRRVRLPRRSHPAGLAVDAKNRVWYAASGLGLVGRLDPARGRPAEFSIPSIREARHAIPSPWALAIGGGEVWFSVQSGGLVGRVAVDAESRHNEWAIREVSVGMPTARPDGVAVDGAGGVWVAETGADRLTRIDPRDGTIAHVALAAGSHPRGLAAAPDGAVWVALAGRDELARLEPSGRRLRPRRLPASVGAHPHAVAVALDGGVWVSTLAGNALLRLDPRTGRFDVVPLPTPRAGVRALAVDPRGQIWYAASGSGRLGVVE